MEYVKFCPHCANISWPAFTKEEFQELVNSNNTLYKSQIECQHGYYNNICDGCKNSLMETKITVEEYASYIGYDYTIDKYHREPENEENEEEINNKILDEYIKPLNLLETESEKYIENMLTFYGINLYPQPAYTPTPTGILMAQQMAQNKPKCPTCSSTNIEKISSFDKTAGAVLFGLFSKTAKSQFKCRNCGYKW